MRDSSNKDVQDFIDQIRMMDEAKYGILEQLREIVFDLCPEVDERMMYGGIILSHSEDFGGLFVYKNHLSFEFSLGFKFKDPDKLLEGGGKYRRHLKIRPADGVNREEVSFFVRQACSE